MAHHIEKLWVGQYQKIKAVKSTMAHGSNNDGNIVKIYLFFWLLNIMDNVIIAFAIIVIIAVILAKRSEPQSEAPRSTRIDGTIPVNDMEKPQTWNGVL